MADIDPVSILKSIYESNQGRMDQLQQPAPRQGGVLSNADPVMLSLAAGLLSPTRTGSFSESLGSGLTAAQGPLAEMRRQEAARADKLSTLQNAQAKLAMDLYDIQSGGRRSRGDDASIIAQRLNGIADRYEQAAKFLDDSDPQKSQYLAVAKEYRKKADAAVGVEIPDIPPTVPIESETQDEGDGGWWSENMPTWLGGKEETPKAQPKSAEPAGKTSANPYTGDSPPADYPTAQKGKDGYWYVKQGNGYARVVE